MLVGGKKETFCPNQPPKTSKQVAHTEESAPLLIDCDDVTVIHPSSTFCIFVGHVRTIVERQQSAN